MDPCAYDERSTNHEKASLEYVNEQVSPDLLLTVLFPTYGWHYDPTIAFIVTAATAGIVTFLWGPKTLARYRYARSGKTFQSSTVY